MERELLSDQPTTLIPFLNEIVCGDSFELLRHVPDNSIDLIMTSPPYFQQRQYDGGGFGNEETPQAYIATLVRFFKECVRVIKPTGSIVINLGDKYKNGGLLLIPYRFALAAIDECGVFLVNQITWVKSNPLPRPFKNKLVNSTEPFFHFVKSPHYSYFPNEFLKASNHSTSKRRADKNIGKTYFDLIEQSKLTPEQKNEARVALEEVIREVRRGDIQDFRMNIRGIHALPFRGQNGGRQSHLERRGFTIIRFRGQPLKRDVITSPVASLKGCPHPSVFPAKLVEEFIHLLTREGDVVLDPFVGAGTTAVVALMNHRRYIGFDISDVYCSFAKERISKVITQNQLSDKQS